MISLVLLKLKISLSSAILVFKRPIYILIAAIAIFITSSLIVWSLNLDLVKYIIFDAPLNFWQKIDFFFDSYRSIYSTYNSLQGSGIIVFSALFGINLALLIYVLKNQGFASIPKKSGISGFTMAIIGGGCIACGTSIIAPVIATTGATSTAFLSELSAALSWLGSVLIAYSIYKLGAVCSFIQASKNLQHN